MDIDMKLLIEQLLDMLKALSDQTRLRIFWVLQKAATELCVCELIDILDQTQYNVSRHLKILKY
ncbi:MAG: metalloregulator ArsR/SmtB family transcription factor, partial [candidate division WOR-3 bacterium]